MRKLSKKYNILAPFKVGEIIKGRILNQEGASLFIDLGPQGTGIIRGKEYQAAKEQIKELSPGQELFAKVVDLETEDGYIELSIKDAQEEALWQELEEKQQKREIFKVKILGANKGGLLAKVRGVAAFLPVSQLTSQHYPKVEGGDPQKILAQLREFVGKELEVSIFSLDPKQNQIILSERLSEAEKKKEILKNYKEGDVVEGEITGICDFGAFIRFPSPVKASKEKTKENPGKKEEILEESLEGLIHISELDWQLVENPAEVVKVGQKVKAKILQIQDDKIFLSLKAFKKNPWQGIEKKLKKGEICKGKVKKLNPYGAFVEILPKIQGLCHISEFGSQKKMEAQLKVGKTYDFKILMLDPKEYKISLQLVKKEETL